MISEEQRLRERTLENAPMWIRFKVGVNVTVLVVVDILFFFKF